MVVQYKELLVSMIVEGAPPAQLSALFRGAAGRASAKKAAGGLAS